ncbi:MAG TPA: aldose epimerase family protein [Candidatus Hydrogenedentes bacterium]|nr:aldose epimerase family protein [Candidatus Hydrogenedentota bacterium]
MKTGHKVCVFFAVLVAVAAAYGQQVVHYEQVQSCCGGNEQRSEAPMTIHKRPFGTTPEGAVADLYLLAAASDFKAAITNYGGILVSLWAPDRNGKTADIVLGFDDVSGYAAKHPYFGAIVGRYGNRIAGGQFTLDGKMYSLAQNDGPNHLHGGVRGFDKALWTAEPLIRDDAVGLKLTHTSPNGDEGYPGNLSCTVTYWLTNTKTLEIEYTAVTDAPTPVNLTNHSYFNLKGHNGGDILTHELTLFADRFTPVDETLIPTGELRPVEGTPFDFRTAAAIGARINTEEEQLVRGKGYDHNFVLDADAKGRFVQAARVREPQTGRVLEVYTTEPGVQFYCGNFLDGSNVGKGGAVYNHRNGFCLETQHFPDSPNQATFPSTVLRPGQMHHTQTHFRFLTD